jgi:voltage-gated potassium channel
MAFAAQASAATVLVALTLLFQSAGMAALIHWVRSYLERGMHRFGVFRSGVLMVRFTSAIIALHLLQILLWAGFYRWTCFLSWEPAFYFSASTYSTVGSGDLLLPRMWRSLGAVESVTGVLMCGLSAGLLFAIVTRLVAREARFAPGLVRPAGERASTPPSSNASRWTERRG